MLSGRLPRGPKPGPACVKQILTNYGTSVVPESYDLSPDFIRGIKQSFCVESVGSITRTGSGTNRECTFVARVRDFMQAQTELTLNFGTETLSSETEDRCDEMARCFAHASLSCAQANFCRAPGLIERDAP